MTQAVLCLFVGVIILAGMLTKRYRGLREYALVSGKFNTGLLTVTFVAIMVGSGELNISYMTH